MNAIFKRLHYYVWATYRRKILDRLHENASHYYTGRVLDIGGRDRGARKPRTTVEQWIFLDIIEAHNPDIVASVEDMSMIETQSIDVISALELFEHVACPERGLDECVRVLKKGGVMLVSTPFLYPIHGDPSDYQRWTKHKWKKELNERGMKIIMQRSMGFYFTVLGDMLKAPTRLSRLRYLSYLFYPAIDLVVSLDSLVSKNSTLRNYTTGYFIIAKKH